MKSVGVHRIRMFSIRRGLLALILISLLKSSMVSCELQTDEQNDGIIIPTNTTDVLSEADKSKKSSLLSSPGAGVISSYLAGVGAQSLVNNNLRLRTSTSTLSPPRFQQRPQVDSGYRPPGNGYTRKPRPTTTPRPQNPPDYVDSPEVIYEVQTNPPNPYTPPPRRQVVVQNQRLSYEQYLQILEEKHKQEEQKLHQSKTTQKSTPVQQTTRDPYYYEYEADTRDKKPSSVAPAKINQPTRITTTPSANHKFQTQQQQQQLLAAAAGIQQKPEDYDIDYLDSPKTTPAVVSNANVNQNQGVGNSPLSQLQNPLGQFQQGQNGYPSPLQQFPSANTVNPLEYQLQLVQLQRLQQLQYLLQLQQLQQQAQALAQAQVQTQMTTPSTWDLITPAGIFINPRLEPTRIPSSTHNPENSIQNIGGLFGSLAVGDLAGVVDNSLRLYQNGVFENLNHLTSCGFGGCTGTQQGTGVEDEDATPKPGGFGSVLTSGKQKIPHPPQDRYPG